MTTMSNRKIALVTGANKGIGKAIVRGLAQAGFVVYLARCNEERGRSAAAELEQVGDIHFVQLDVLDAASVAAAAQQIASEAGKLDTLVNNAGIGYAPGSRFGAPYDEIPENIRSRSADYSGEANRGSPAISPAGAILSVSEIGLYESNSRPG